MYLALPSMGPPIILRPDSIGVLRHELGMTLTPSDLELIRCSPVNGCGQLKP